MVDIVEYLISLKDEFSDKAEKINKQIEKITGSGSKLDRRISMMSNSFGHMGKSLSGFITAPILAFGAASLYAESKIEDLTVSFQGLLGSKEKADKLVETLDSFANTKANVSLDRVAVSARSLLTAGVPVEQLTKQLQSLGDVAAGSGKTTMEQLAQLSSRVVVRGFATSRDVQQLQVQGVNIKKGLAEMFHLNPNSVADSLKLRKIMDHGGVSAKAFNAALMGLASEGGPFSGSMAAKLNTMGGATQEMGKAFDHVFESAGGFMVHTIKLPELMNKFSFALINVTDKVKKLAEENPGLAKFVLVFSAIVAAIGPVLLIVSALGKAFLVLGNIMRFVFYTNPWTAALMALIAVITLVVLHWDTVKAAVLSMAHTTVNEIHKIENAVIRLINKLNIFHKMKLKTVDPELLGIGTKVKQGQVVDGQFMPSIPTMNSNNNSKVDVNVNIDDKNQNVKSVTSKAKGDAKFNVGTNMAGTAAAGAH